MSYKKLVLALVSVLVFSLLLAIPAMGAAGFVKYAGNPVLVTGAVLSWDETLVGAACVIYEGSTYKMWYTGGDADGSLNIGYATSPDGINWIKDFVNNPVLSHSGNIDDWDGFAAAAPWVINDGGTYKMWYTGVKGLVTQIGYATSPDGVNWTKYGSNPVLPIGAFSEWDQNNVALSCVIKDGSVYKMWYTGRTGSGMSIGNVAIGYATSPNGTIWIKEASNPVLIKSATATDFDGNAVLAACVTKSGTNYTMYYTGLTVNLGANQARIGKATSTDGMVWNKSSSPVLNIGDPGSWDEKGVAAPCVLEMSGTTKMWYTGGNNNLAFRIGYADILPTVAVPASSNLSMGFIIGGITILMAAVLWGTRRFQHRSR
jgi:predicted GH43/DUF377 family glycosyl hydrolase